MNIEDANIAGAVLTFDRPEYTYKFINSLENCVNTEDVDWIFFQDGAVNKFSGDRVANDNKIKINKNILETADLENKEIRENEYNISIALQRDVMFNLYDEGYDLILHFENDIILGKYSIRLLKLMMQQFDDSIMSVYRGKSFNKISNPKENLDVVIQPNNCGETFFLYTIGIWKSSFRKFEDDWRRYIELIGDIDYRNRPSKLSDENFGGIDAASDAVIRYLATQYNIKKLNLAVSRASYIGMEGTGFDTANYLNNWDHGSEGPLEFEADKEIDEFYLQQ